jgi:hypothetical protein
MRGRSKSSDLLRPLAIQFLLCFFSFSSSSSSLSCLSSPLVSGYAGLKEVGAFDGEDEEEGESAGEGEEGVDFDDLGVIVFEGQDILLVCF